jgi:hypothetical protein
VLRIHYSPSLNFLKLTIHASNQPTSSLRLIPSYPTHHLLLVLLKTPVAPFSIRPDTSHTPSHRLSQRHSPANIVFDERFPRQTFRVHSQPRVRSNKTKQLLLKLSCEAQYSHTLYTQFRSLVIRDGALSARSIRW